MTSATTVIIALLFLLDLVLQSVVFNPSVTNASFKVVFDYFCCLWYCHLLLYGHKYKVFVLQKADMIEAASPAWHLTISPKENMYSQWQAHYCVSSWKASFLTGRSL